MSRAASLALLALTVALAGCTAPDAPSGGPPGEHAPMQPYAGLEESPIRGLTSQQIEDYRTGAGAGLSLPAELNGYPGPKHVLELASELGLTAWQHARIQTLRSGVVAEATAAGERVLQAHHALDQAFRAGPPSAMRLEGLLADVAAAEAALRGVHLRAHLATLDVLTPEQVQRYAALRGYGEGDAPAHGGAGHGGH